MLEPPKNFVFPATNSESFPDETTFFAALSSSIPIELYFNFYFHFNVTYSFYKIMKQILCLLVFQYIP